MKKKIKHIKEIDMLNKRLLPLTNSKNDPFSEIMEKSSASETRPLRNLFLDNDSKVILR